MNHIYKYLMGKLFGNKVHQQKVKTNLKIVLYIIRKDFNLDVITALQTFKLRKKSYTSIISS